jgi:hypothetical protein
MNKQRIKGFEHKSKLKCPTGRLNSIQEQEVRINVTQQERSTSKETKQQL